MQVGLHFGFLAAPIRKQLREQRVHLRSGMAKEIAQCQKDADALCRLGIRRILTESQRERGRQKVLRAVLKCCFIPAAKRTEAA